ncbi:hypothetical protein ACIVBQ_000137 [Tenacibaculum discolor]
MKNKHYFLKNLLVTLLLLIASQVYAINQPCWLKELIKDLAKPDVSIEFKTFFKDAPEANYEAYKILYRGNKTKLRYDIEALKTVKRLKADENFVNYIESLQIPNVKNVDEFLGKITGWYNQSSEGKKYIEVLENMQTFVSTLKKSNTQCNNCVYLFNRFIVNDTPTGVNRQACFWLMEDVAANPNMINNKTISVEAPVTGVDGTIQRVDLKVGNSPGVNLEYKWLSSDTPIGKETFIREFVKRDLFSVNSLEEIQWRIKWNSSSSNKLTKDQMIVFLSSIEGKEALKAVGYEKLKRIFPDDGFMNVNNFVDRVIKNFDNETTFNKIFIY